MYYLMNKDKRIISFKPNIKSSLSADVSFDLVEQDGQLPYGFHNITTWIESRKASKHNSHLKEIMVRLGCDDNEGFIRMTHAVGINDTFWIKSDEENISWNDVSLFRNQFTEIISRLAFEGAGLYGEMFSSTSPELSCEGSFRKCFRKEKSVGEFGSDIFLYKGCGELGSLGLEPYCEILASEIAQIVAPALLSVKYELSQIHGKIASKCNIFTNEHIGYASFSKMNDLRTYSFDDVIQFYEKIGCEQGLRELLVVDSLCFNQDRHSGNYGVLFDNDTMDIIGMSPIFDLNLSMLPYVDMEDFDHIGDKLYGYAPKLGNDFTRIGQIAMNDIIRDRLKNIMDYTFCFRGDDVFTTKRVIFLEDIIHKQAKAILSNDKIMTKDVFFSKEAALEELKREKSDNAIYLLSEFEKRIDDISFITDSYVSVCEEMDTVQFYLENDSYMLIVDFLDDQITIQQNAREISFDKLKNDNPAFYKDAMIICDEYSKFIFESKKKDLKKSQITDITNIDGSVKNKLI